MVRARAEAGEPCGGTRRTAGAGGAGRKPAWLKARLTLTPRGALVDRLIRELGLHTVCRSALCPNRNRCFSRGTATFMILGDRCSRRCPYCAVAPGAAGLPDPDEPERVAAAARALGLRHAVVTSVTRDDLPDGGAAHFARTVGAIRGRCPEATVEVLVPDFGGREDCVRTVLAGGPDVFNHNVETVPRLYPRVRPQGDYARSLAVLSAARAAAPGAIIKSGLMVGLGEGEGEVLAVLADLRRVGCDVVTLGQYLQPSPAHLPVAEYLHPRRFAAYRRAALEMGFRAAFAGPLVRSSFHADTLFSSSKRR